MTTPDDLCYDCCAECSEERPSPVKDCPDYVQETEHRGDAAEPHTSAGAFYVYVAGPLSGDPGHYLANVARLSETCRLLHAAGFVTINPAGDLVEGLCSTEPTPVASYQSRSMALLELLAFAPAHRRALYVDRHERLDGTLSGGVSREIERAGQLGVPVVHCFTDLAALRGSEP